MSIRCWRCFTVDDVTAHLLDEEDRDFFGEDRQSQSHENSNLVEFRARPRVHEDSPWRDSDE